MAKALHLFEGTLCHGCGHSTLETGDPDREGWYEAEVTHCAGCMALDKARADDGDPGPGARYAVRLNRSYPGPQQASGLMPSFAPPAPPAAPAA